MKFLLPLLVISLFTSSLSAAEFDSALNTAVDRCNNIGSREYETGMWLNPEGYRSYYKRSFCIQRAAIEFRSMDLCNDVRRRFALFSSSWGYSRGNCKLLVETELAEDRNEIELLRANYSSGPIRVASLSVVPNGNGRDYDFIPRFGDGFVYSYQMEFRIRDDSGAPRTILSHGSYLTGSADNIRLFLRRAELLERFPGLEFGKAYVVELHMQPAIGMRKQNGWLRAELLEEVFPLDERTQVYSTSVSF